MPLHPAANVPAQDIKSGKAEVYGQSVTDACIGWPDTDKLLRSIAEAVRAKRQLLSKGKCQE